MKPHVASTAVLMVLSISLPVSAQDHRMFGGTPQRNMANLVEKVFQPTFPVAVDDPNVRILGNRVQWQADLGSRCYGSPVVAGGKVFIGTNNERPRNKRDRRPATMEEPGGEPTDKAILMCFDEKTGVFQWQMVHDKLERGAVNDWPRLGICSTPVIDGERLYYVSNRCEVMCLDVNGFANGNQGFKQEKYQDKTDGDVLWSVDMRAKFGVEPHSACSSSPLIVGDWLFVVTGNGVDESHEKVANPDAPSFLCLNKTTGELRWHSNLPGKNIMHGQWSSPAYGELGGQKQIIFPGGDGWLYGFEPDKGELIWKFDANLKMAKHELNGTGTKNDFLGTPVVYQGKIYIGTGQDPEHARGQAYLWCLDPAGKRGDVSAELRTDDPAKPKANPNSAVVWRYGGPEQRMFAPRDEVFGRTLSTACIVDDVLYLGETDGFVHCLDARTGKPYWVLDVRCTLYSSCVYAAGKIFVTTDDGDVWIIKHEKTPKAWDIIDRASASGLAAMRAAQLEGRNAMEARRIGQQTYRRTAKALHQELVDHCVLQRVTLDDPLHATPCLANGVLFLATERTLYAIKSK